MYLTDECSQSIVQVIEPLGNEIVLEVVVVVRLYEEHELSAERNRISPNTHR